MPTDVGNRGHPPAIRAKALDLYLATSKSLKQIGTDCGVPTETVKTWMVVDKWVEKRQELAKDIAARILAEQTDIVAQHRGRVMKEQLNLAGRLNKAVGQCLDEGVVATPDGDVKTYDSNDLARLARAFKASADVEARVVGLDKQSAQSGDVSAQQQVVQINLNPKEIDPAKRAKTVNVKPLRTDF